MQVVEFIIPTENRIYLLTNTFRSKHCWDSSAPPYKAPYVIQLTNNGLVVHNLLIVAITFAILKAGYQYFQNVCQIHSIKCIFKLLFLCMLCSF